MGTGKFQHPFLSLKNLPANVESEFILPVILFNDSDKRFRSSADSSLFIILPKLPFPSAAEPVVFFIYNDREQNHSEKR